jgi:trans-aconitate 2-methyltransferase
MPRDWDARTYDRIADPQARWGRAVLDRLPLSPDDRVLDAGCGTGRVTELLLARLPRGQVVAVDASPLMLEEARRRLGEGPQIQYVLADLAEPLPVGEPVDAILSTATFHWIPDHDALFANLASVLRSGGRLVAQCGGYGNIESVHRAVRQIDEHLVWTKNFATAEKTRERLEHAGFVEVRTWLHDEPTTFPSTEALETFLATVILREVLESVPEERRPVFVREVASRLPRPEIDYVRLNIDARRA